MQKIVDHFGKNWKVYSRAGTFVFGIAVGFHEVFIVDTAEPSVLLFAAGCLGFVTSWTLDDLRNSKNGPRK